MKVRVITSFNDKTAVPLRRKETTEDYLSTQIFE